MSSSGSVRLRYEMWPEIWGNATLKKFTFQRLFKLIPNQVCIRFHDVDLKCAKTLQNIYMRPDS